MRVRLPSSKEPSALATVWVKARLSDVNEGQYSAKKGVDLQQTVDDFKASWASAESPGVRPGLIFLRLVNFDGDEPTEEEEAAAKLLLPRLTLAAAGVTDGCLLLACMVGTAVASQGECGVCCAVAPCSGSHACALHAMPDSRVQLLRRWHLSRSEACS